MIQKGAGINRSEERKRVRKRKESEKIMGEKNEERREGRKGKECSQLKGVV